MRLRGHPIARAGAAAMVVVACAAALVFASASRGNHPGGTRPQPIGHTEGYGNFKVASFFYPQQFFCTDEPFDDLDGPGHQGDGVRSAQDPDEFQHPAVGPPGSPCIVGDTGSGSLPTIDPTGKPVANAEKVWAMLPVFDSVKDADTTPEFLDPSRDGSDVQCPEPGPPYTVHMGEFGTCTMHPSSLHAEPAVAIAAGDIPLPNHSHIVRNGAFEINPVWWQTIAVRVLTERIWPDFNGRCPANPRGGPPCLTSLDALRAAQQRGEAGPDTPTNVWLFFDSHEVHPQPAGSSGSGGSGSG
jgi:hypothetical protein